MPKSKEPPATRLYVVNERGVTNPETGETAADKPVALINAQNAAQAAKHFLHRKYAVTFAEQRDVFAAAKAGVEIETAAEES